MRLIELWKALLTLTQPYSSLQDPSHRRVVVAFLPVGGSKWVWEAPDALLDFERHLASKEAQLRAALKEGGKFSKWGESVRQALQVRAVHALLCVRSCVRCACHAFCGQMPFVGRGVLCALCTLLPMGMRCARCAVCGQVGAAHAALHRCEFLLAGHEHWGLDLVGGQCL